MADRDFMGVPESALLAVGKVTVAAGLLEEAAQDIAYVLGGKAEEHADRLRSLAHEGIEHLIGLLPEIRKGIYLRQPRHEGEPWFIGRYLEDEGRYPDRLSEEELDEVWEQYVVRPRRSN